MSNRLKEFREQKVKLSQRGLSAASGISPVTICKIENYETQPRYGTMVMLAEALGEPVGRVFPDDISTKKPTEYYAFTKSSLTVKWLTYCKRNSDRISSGDAVVDIREFGKVFIKDLFGEGVDHV